MPFAFPSAVRVPAPTRTLSTTLTSEGVWGYTIWVAEIRFGQRRLKDAWLRTSVHPENNKGWNGILQIWSSGKILRPTWYKAILSTKVWRREPSSALVTSHLGGCVPFNMLKAQRSIPRRCCAKFFIQESWRDLHNCKARVCSVCGLSQTARYFIRSILFVCNLPISGFITFSYLFVSVSCLLPTFV